MKIKHILFLVLIALCKTSVAQSTSSFSFTDIKLNDLVKFSFSQMLNLSYIADDAFIKDERRLSLDLKPQSASQLQPLIYDLIRDYGYTIKEFNGVLKIQLSKEKNDELETLIYRPKYRPASYLVDTAGIGSNRASPNNTGNSALSAGTFNTATENKQEANSASQYIDRNSDVVIVKQKPAEIEQTRRTLEALDRPAQQVDIKVTVYEFNTGKKNATAIGAILDIAKGKLTAQYGAIDAIGDFIKLDTKAIQLLLSVVDSDNRFTMISSPNLRARSGVKSKITVGSDVPTLSASTQGNGNVTQSVTYQKTGVTLEVQPTVMINAIDLNVRQSISDAIKTITGVNNTPTLTSRELQTQVTMLSGDSIVLGGLQSRSDAITRSGLSFLPRLFDSRSNDGQTSEIVVFLTVSKVQ
jgi:general secretion pathway protein D